MAARLTTRTDYQSIQVPDGTDWLEYMLNVSPIPTLKQAGVMDHFSLGVAHMADAIAALERNKCEGPNCAKTQVGRDGKVQLNLFDPDFTRVEFMEFTPAKEPCCSPLLASTPARRKTNSYLNCWKALRRAAPAHCPAAFLWQQRRWYSQPAGKPKPGRYT